MKLSELLFEGRDNREIRAWDILLHPETGSAYPEDQISKLLKTLNRNGKATLKTSNKRNLKIAMILNTPGSEDDVWDLISKADVDDELGWGGSIVPNNTAEKRLKQQNEAIEMGDDVDPVAQALFNELRDLLEEARDDLKSSENADTSYKIGGALSAVKSGVVKLVKNYTQHGPYGINTQWDLCLQVGTNIKGKKALDVVKSLYNEALKEAKDFEPTKLETTSDDVFHAHFDDGKVSCTYDYGSGFCIVAIKKTTK